MFLGSETLREYRVLRFREDRYRLAPADVETGFAICDSADGLVIPITVDKQVVFVGSTALERVDYQSLQVRLEPPALRKQEPQISIDLSGIAKGYAVDLVANLLDRATALPATWSRSAARCEPKGDNLDGQAWRIGLEKPLTDRRAIESVLEVRDCQLASSGDFRNFFEWEGRLYSHVIDPRIGWPVEDGLAAVWRRCRSLDRV